MIQNHLEEMSGNRYNKCKFDNSGYCKFFKTKNNCQNRLPKNYARFDFKAECTRRGTTKM